MSDIDPGRDAAGDSPISAGGLLRQARKAQGLHIAALAAAIKVPPQKLEALESDRFEQLPDATFTRALAQTVCRVLKIDPEPVLSRLPQGASHRLERMEGGLNAPFRERPGRGEPSDLGLLRRPVVWGPGLLVLAAAALLLLPTDVLRPLRGQASAPAASAAVPPPAASVPQAAGPASPSDAAPVPVVPEAAAATAPVDAGGLAAAQAPLVVSTSGESWVEVVDAQGRTLVSRMVNPGETLGLDGAPPYRLRIGNVRNTQVSYGGQPVDLAPRSRDNVARFELK